MRMEHSLHEIDHCALMGDVLCFRDLKVRHGQHIVCSVTTGTSVLNYACQSGVLTMVMEVIKAEQEFGCNRPSLDKEIALCVDLGHYLLIQPLIEYGSVNVNNVIVNGKSLIERAAVNGDIATFRELEHLGAIPSDMVLTLASAQNRFLFLQDLLNATNHLQSSNYNLNFQDKRRKCSAHFAAEKGNTEVVRLLLDKGLDINLKDKRDFTILHSAASGGSVATVQAVLDACERQHVLHRMLMARDRYLGSERCFLVCGHDNDQPAWHYVEVHRRLIDIFQKKTQRCSVDAIYDRVKRSGWGTNPTQEVVQETGGLYDVVNAHMNGPLDMQPLHVAILNNHEPAALLLISVMEDVGQPDSVGLTPLHMAAKRGHNKAIEALLDKGAQHEVTDAMGRTPLDIATTSGQQKAGKLLKLRAQVDAIEGLRGRFRSADHDLTLQRLQQLVHEGGDPECYMASRLRDLFADIADFLYDILHRTSVVTESGLV